MEKHPRVGLGVYVLKDNKVLLGKRIGIHGKGFWNLGKLGKIVLGGKHWKKQE